MKTIEYRVRPVTRYIVTRYTQEAASDSGPCGAGSELVGEFPSGAAADSVADAMVIADQSRGMNARRQRSGLSLGEVISGKRIESA
jgi:hypothetical protein